MALTPSTHPSNHSPIHQTFLPENKTVWVQFLINRIKRLLYQTSTYLFCLDHFMQLILIFIIHFYCETVLPKGGKQLFWIFLLFLNFFELFLPFSSLFFNFLKTFFRQKISNLFFLFSPVCLSKHFPFYRLTSTNVQ